MMAFAALCFASYSMRHGGKQARRAAIRCASPAWSIPNGGGSLMAEFALASIRERKFGEPCDFATTL
jgi:hypothetical protein